jgi:hypothetical protein
MSTDIHVAGTANGGARWVGSSAQDHYARAAVVIMFTLLVLGNFYGATQAVLDWSHQSLEYTSLHVAARLSSALFAALIATTALTRLRPIQKAAGIEPRVSALLGSFMVMTLPSLPRPELPAAALAISSVLIVIGMMASFLVLRWLGKSFSIMAEARRLITHGPYALVRHPLYICEEIAVVNVYTGHVACGISPALTPWFTPLHAERRKVLKSFAEYGATLPNTPSHSFCLVGVDDW